MKKLILIAALFALTGCRTFGIVKDDTCERTEFVGYSNCEIIK